MNTSPLQFSLEPADNARLNRLCGALDENLRQIETALEVVISRRGEHFNVRGETRKAHLARQVLQDFYLDAKHDISLEKLQLGLIEAMCNDGAPDAQSEFVPLLMTRKSEIRGRASDTLPTKSADCGRRRDASTPAPVGFAAPCRGRASDTLPTKSADCGRRRDASTPAPVGFAAPCRGRASDTLPTKSADCGRRRDASTPAPVGFAAPCRGRTPRQNDYLQAIQQHDITFGVGPAGTGKTYLAVASAVDALQRDAVRRLVLVRPAVEAGERLGFLPGDMAQKVDPYLRPLYDALYDLMGSDKVVKAFERGVIEIAPLAYMRGRTINHSFIILDEAQNTTPEQMKMFLTRIGFGSKAVITGDVTQIDLGRGQMSGLIEVRNVLKDVRGIAFQDFLAEDVVRHPLVQKIVSAYEQHDRRKKV